MDTETVRLNITLPKGLVQAMDRVTEPRKRSRFIAEAVRQKIEQKEKEAIDKLLEEGYQTAAIESLTLTKEFESADLEAGMTIKRGGIYLAALDPVVGNEISKTRPVAVISNDKNNEFSGTVTVLPLTSKNLRKIYPFEVFLDKGTGNLPKNSKVKADQIRTLDKSRLIKLIGKLGEKEIEAIEKAIKIHLSI